MSKKNKKKKVLSKNERTQREFEHQRKAREGKEATPTAFPKVKSYLNSKAVTPEPGTKVELTSIQIDTDRKQVVHVDESGVRTVSDIEEIKLMDPSSQAWKEYVRAGGDPAIPEGEIPVQIITKNTKTGDSGRTPLQEDGAFVSSVGTTTNEGFGMIKALTTISPSVQAAIDKTNLKYPLKRSAAQDSEMLPLIIKSIHPESRKVLPAEEALAHLDVQETESPAGSFRYSPMSEKLFNQARDRIKHAASIDPNEEILVKQVMDRPNSSDKNSSLLYSSLSESDIGPGIDNKELNLVFNLLTDTTTRRIRFDQLNYPVWEGHDTHPTRNEGFITKPPFPNMYVQFDGFVNLPPMTREPFLFGSELYKSDDEMLYDLIEQKQNLDGVPITREMSISIGAMAFSDEIQHLLIRKNSNGTARTILPQEGKTWKITPPQGTNSNYDGYSTGKHDSIMLGYLQWFGLLMDSNHQGLAKINQGAYFDINTGAIWLPLTKITGGQSEEVIHAPDVFQVEKNRMSTHLIPAGSGIESSDLSEDWDSNRKMNIFEDAAMRVGDIFMFMMNYMTSPRMQTEEILSPRGDRRRAQKQGLPPPPPWTTISYKPPSSIKRNSVATGTGSKHSYMYDVRGHWKNQPHGPGREQRKLIWVHPHYSGLANEKYVPRNRLVQEKDEYEDIKIS